MILMVGRTLIGPGGRVVVHPRTIIKTDNCPCCSGEPGDIIPGNCPTCENQVSQVDYRYAYERRAESGADPGTQANPEWEFNVNSQLFFGNAMRQSASDPYEGIRFIYGKLDQQPDYSYRNFTQELTETTPTPTAISFWSQCSNDTPPIGFQSLYSTQSTTNPFSPNAGFGCPLHNSGYWDNAAGTVYQGFGAATWDSTYSGGYVHRGGEPGDPIDSFAICQVDVTVGAYSFSYIDSMHSLSNVRLSTAYYQNNSNFVVFRSFPVQDQAWLQLGYSNDIGLGGGHFYNDLTLGPGETVSYASAGDKSTDTFDYGEIVFRREPDGSDAYQSIGVGMARQHTWFQPSTWPLASAFEAIEIEYPTFSLPTRDNPVVEIDTSIRTSVQTFCEGASTTDLVEANNPLVNVETFPVSIRLTGIAGGNPTTGFGTS